MNSLPFEVIEYIARLDNQTWLRMVQIFKYLAEKSLDKQYISELKCLFLRRKEDTSEYEIEYRLPNGMLHTADDPCIDIYGNQKWYQNNQLHRDHGLPATVYDNGSQSWYQNGKMHRDHDLPAVIYANGDQVWYQYGQRHRNNDLPAVICFTGDQFLYQYGKLIKSS